MSTITTRAAKGIPLTHTEVDANFTNLNNDKLELSAGGQLLKGTSAYSGNLLLTGGGVGYGTGSGGAVTQATSKTTGVTLNKVSGAITMNAASLAANTVAAFTFTNSTIAATDVVHVCVKSGMATGGSYNVSVDAVNTGSCNISVRNLTSGARAEALVLNFVVIKGATS